MGGIYEEQKSHKPQISYKEKKLIVLHNFTSLETCDCIKKEMKDAATDIIIVSNELLCKDKKETAQYLKRHLNRECNVIEVANLESMRILQRIFYGLLEKNSFIARDADRIVFSLLSEYSQGMPTIVHLLTSLMQDNNRTSFEHVKQQINIVYQRYHSQSTNQVERKFIQLQNLGLSDMLRISLPTCYFLSSLSIFGPVPLPLFYVKELDDLVSTDKKHTSCQSLVKELEDNGVIRKYSYPLVYHKEFNPFHSTSPGFSTQLIYVPKLICDAVKSEMNYDNGNAILYAQQAIENVSIQNPTSPYIPVLWSYLKDFCKEQQQQQPELGLERMHQVSCIFPMPQ